MKSSQSASFLVAPLLVAAAWTTLQTTVEGAAAPNNKYTRNSMPFIRQQDFPKNPSSPGGSWQELDEKSAFLPADGMNAKDLRNFMKTPSSPLSSSRGLREDDDDYYERKGDGGSDFEKDWADDDVYRVQPFAQGVDEYDEYQQAWRLLGFMIDCHANFDDDDGSWDGGTGEGCDRFVLWAAYVDLEYEGNGIAEYQFWDRFNGKWDDDTCYYGNDGYSRCAKMDCHLEDTHFSLLGFFKHRSYDDWMEQLFKHEGMCVWTEEEYAFMGNSREAWPQGCSDSGSTFDDGSPIYYDLMPLTGGSITVSLYTDTKCLSEYTPGNNDPITPANILGNILANNGGSGDSGDNGYDFSGYTLDQSLEAWDSAFSVWKTCHPCVAYDIENTDGTAYADDDGGYGNGDPFDCYDDADYTNVNQCMKFMAKTAMNTATFRDLGLARSQGTLAAAPLSGYKQNRRSYYRSSALGTLLTYVFFFLSLCICGYALMFFLKVKREVNYVPQWGFKEPLVDMS